MCCQQSWSRGLRKTVVTPLLTLWSKCSLALSDRSGDSFYIIIVNCIGLEYFSTQAPEMLLRCLSITFCKSDIVFQGHPLNAMFTRRNASTIIHNDIVNNFISSLLIALLKYFIIGWYCWNFLSCNEKWDCHMIYTNCEICDPMAVSLNSRVTVNVHEILCALSWPVLGHNDWIVPSTLKWTAFTEELSTFSTYFHATDFYLIPISHWQTIFHFNSSSMENRLFSTNSHGIISL